MMQRDTSIRRGLPWLYAVGVHVALAALLFVGVKWSVTPSTAGHGKHKPKKQIVQATVVSQADIDKQLAQIKAAKAAKQQRQRAAQKKLEQQAEAARTAREQEQQRLADLKRQRQAAQQAEAAKQAKLKQQREAEQKKEAEHQAELKKQAEAERERLAKLKAEREAAAKKKAADEKRAAEAERQRKEAAERARQAKIAQQKKAATTQMQQELATEQQARNASLIRQYQTVISQKITRNWTRPPSAQKNIDCTVEVEQIPGGQVVKAQVTTCNANDAVRQSIETAVYKASPLPPPPDPSVFSRQLDIHFNPNGQ